MTDDKTPESGGGPDKSLFDEEVLKRVVRAVVDELEKEDPRVASDPRVLREMARQTALEMRALLPRTTLKPIVICCSQMFKPIIDALVPALEAMADKSHAVLSVFEPDFKFHRTDMIQKPEHERLQSRSYRDRIRGLVYAHWRKIKQVAAQGGRCLIFNPLGYIGVNTALELAWANENDMVVLAFTNHHEWLDKAGKRAHPRDGTTVTDGEECLNALIDHAFTDNPQFKIPTPPAEKATSVEDRAKWDAFVEEFYRWLIKYL